LYFFWNPLSWYAQLVRLRCVSSCLTFRKYIFFLYFYFNICPVTNHRSSMFVC
jgi:hypothetical protein